MINKGDRVTIDGKTATVRGWWGQGKTTVYQLSDGRTVFDLHLLVEDGNAKVEATISDIPSLQELETGEPDELIKLGKPATDEALDLDELVDKNPVPEE